MADTMSVVDQKQKHFLAETRRALHVDPGNDIAHVVDPGVSSSDMMHEVGLGKWSQDGHGHVKSAIEMDTNMKMKHGSHGEANAILQDASSVTLLPSTDATPRISAYITDQTYKGISEETKADIIHAIIAAGVEPVESKHRGGSFNERAARAISMLDLDSFDALVTRRVNAISHTSTPTTIKNLRETTSKVYAKVLLGVLGRHPRARRQDAPLAEHLAAIALEIYRFMVERDLDVGVAVDTLKDMATAGGEADATADRNGARALAIGVAEVVAGSVTLSKSVGSVLANLDPMLWDMRCHELALDWDLAVHWPPNVRASESRINGCVYELLSRSYVSPHKIEQEISAMVQAIAETETTATGDPLPLRDAVRLIRWSRLRLRFEETWRWYVRVIDTHNWNATNLPIELVLVRSNALELLNAIIVLGRAFNEHAYVWYLFETATMMDMTLLVGIMAACREAHAASNDDQRDVWEARAWVVYRRANELGNKHHRSYIAFMLEIINLVTQITNISRRYRLLARLYRNMEAESTQTFSPITEKVFAVLVQQCWEQAGDSSRVGEWDMVFDQMMGIYTLEARLKPELDALADGLDALMGNPDNRGKEKVNKDGSGSTPSLRLSPETFLLMLQVCTVSGRLDAFRMLNEDLHGKMRVAGGDDYVAQVKKGYSEYMAKYIESKEMQYRKSDVADDVMVREGSDLYAVDGQVPSERVLSARALGYVWTDAVEGRAEAVVSEVLSEVIG